MRPLNNFAEISANYDLFLLDLWGVVHDGTALYEGVADVLADLKQAGKTVIFISNAPRRSHKVKAVLTELGITPDLYLDAVSSGEVGFQWLADGKSPWGKRYYFIGADKDADMPVGLDIVKVDDIQNADFILNLGFGSEEQTAGDYTILLQNAANLRVPMLCLNPDLEVIKISGERFACAGILAKQYEQLGGVVTSFGKPYADVYDACMKKHPAPKSRVLAVGDSLETDIPGGQKYGVDTLLITGGILKHLTAEQIAGECEQLELHPTYIASSLG